MFDKLVSVIKKHPYISWLVCIILSSIIGAILSLVTTGKFYNGFWFSVFMYLSYLPCIKRRMSKKK